MEGALHPGRRDACRCSNEQMENGESFRLYIGYIYVLCTVFFLLYYYDLLIYIYLFYIKSIFRCIISKYMYYVCGMLSMCMIAVFLL